MVMAFIGRFPSSWGSSLPTLGPKPPGSRDLREALRRSLDSTGVRPIVPVPKRAGNGLTLALGPSRHAKHPSMAPVTLPCPKAGQCALTPDVGGVVRTSARAPGRSSGPMVCSCYAGAPRRRGCLPHCVRDSPAPTVQRTSARRLPRHPVSLRSGR